MSDTPNIVPNIESFNISRDQFVGRYVPKHIAKQILATFEAGTSPFTPNELGIVEPEKIINANTGYGLTGKELISAQIEKQEKGFTSNYVVTSKTIMDARTTVKEGEHGILYNFKDKQGQFRHSRYLFEEQIENPDALRQHVEKKLNYKTKLNGEVFKVERPEDFLPAYLTASTQGAKVAVSPEVYEQFKKTISEVCKNELVKDEALKNPKIPGISAYFYDGVNKSIDLTNKTIEAKGLAPKNKNITQTVEPERKDRDIEMVF